MRVGNSPLISRNVFSGCLLCCALAPSVFGQSWTSTATKALTLNSASLLGPLSPGSSLHVSIGLKTRNSTGIPQMLKEMNTPGSSLYGKSLTPEQFIADFAPQTSQINAVETYLTSYGFKNLAVSSNNLLIQADATVGEIEAAFNTSMATYSLHGQRVYANTSDAQVPPSLAGTVLAVLGLNNLPGLTTPTPPSPTNALNGYSPQDFQVAYDAAYPADATGGEANKQKLSTGSSTAIAVIAEGSLTQVVNDLRTFEKAYKLPQVPVTVVNAGMASSDTSGADEWDLDSQSATGIAQQVAHLYFYVATTLTDSDIALAINSAVSQNKVMAFNMSFGECEILPYLDGAMMLDDEMFAEAALQGQTAFASSGDNGSACPVLPTNGVPGSGLPDVAYPASSPYVIASGGTDLLTYSDHTYDAETVWYSGGGGISLVETAPFWQSYTGSGLTPIVPSAEAGQRGVPDVSMCADPDACAANIYVNGVLEGVGGTSLSSPLSMGAWARIESAHSNKLGFAGPLIYKLASSANPKAVPPTLPSTGPFNDVVLGTNGAYTALPGWDYATGLGSWNIEKVNAVIQ